MSRLGRIATITSLAVILGILAAGVASAADQPVFATMSVEKAFDGYSKKAELEAQLNKDLQQVQQWFELRNANKSLTAEEFDELITLKSKAKPTEADQKKTEDLLNTAKQRDQELHTLEQTSNPTSEQQSRLSTLRETIKGAETAIIDEQKKRSEEFRQRQVELSQQIVKDVEAAVAAVAKEKGILMVFNKSEGDAGPVVYSAGPDITDEVLNKLNKK